MESVRLCLFDGTIDALGPAVTGRMAGERAAGGWHGATGAIAIPAAAEANKQV